MRSYSGSFHSGQRGGHPVNGPSPPQRSNLRWIAGGIESKFWRITKGKNHASLPAQFRWDEAPVPLSTTFPFRLSIRHAQRGNERAIDGNSAKFAVGSGNVLESDACLRPRHPKMALAALAMIDTWQFTPAKKKRWEPDVCGPFPLNSRFYSVRFWRDVPVTDSAHRRFWV